MTETRPAVVTSDGVAMRFRAPAAHLAEIVIDYAFYDSGPAGSAVRHNDYLPGPANLVMTFDAGPVRATVRNHRLEWRNDAVVFGPTSYAFRADSDGGRLIGIGITAIGWARLFGKHAARVADRVVPLASLWEEPRARAFYGALAAAGRDEDAAVTVLDHALTAALSPEGRDMPVIRALTAMLHDPAAVECAEVADRLAVQETQLRRIAKHYFGFGPKRLLRQHRFMRAVAALTGPHAARLSDADVFTPYYDQSHFIRDAHLFLGRTARQFGIALTPIMAGMLRGRTQEFGAPLQGLLEAGRDNLPPHTRWLDGGPAAP
ncbi:hypothetical protein ASG29_09760 [Sphingomonas sp. Leaf412]|uniref:helix-turn-helix domain-containing protein n=1 Tax=Sphingomonas sp. Leaf412 TaxID=1736370 RepID=UPI0006F46206|nr:helix-turn-helix domain-containing protein [Sphingomonas sp. Leaf412]KQT32119.1 hypothetical protein ASG29_09760 [Sphingomonas sp. Leaf412]